jgi:hypothetical protein
LREGHGSIVAPRKRFVRVGPVQDGETVTDEPNLFGTLRLPIRPARGSRRIQSIGCYQVDGPDEIVGVPDTGVIVETPLTVGDEHDGQLPAGT